MLLSGRGSICYTSVSLCFCFLVTWCRAASLAPVTGSLIVLPFNLPLSTISAHRISHLVAPEKTCLNRFSLFLTLKNQLFY